MPPSTTTLRLILGDQLNPLHSWFSEARADVVYVLMEVRQETDYVHHHAQKIIAIFAAMRALARQLEGEGHRVHYLRIDDPANLQAIPANIDALLAHYGATRFEYQEPDEYRLDLQLAHYAARLPVPGTMVGSEHFLTARDEAERIFAGRAQWLMEHFYRQMRLVHGVLVEQGGKPAGGQWNFDHDNRKPWRGAPPEPFDARVQHDHSALWESIRAAGVDSFGRPDAARIVWPQDRAEALTHLDAFIQHGLPHFGDYQDAMHTSAPRLFHSMLSFALNTKMLHPREVIAEAEDAWRAGHAPLHAVEGFIRQILGWREYVRGVYWANMPGYGEHNVFAHTTPLPSWFWDGKTKMRCLRHAIGQSLDAAHAHHIQRLMIIGNFSLLAGLEPNQVHQWYLGVYVDAFEWVEMPNTIGMSQFADGGLLATKPYVSSAAYIDRMSDYCKGCHYDKKARLGETACPFNALYWNFFERNAQRLSGNQRLGMVYRNLFKMDDAARAACGEQAAALRARLGEL
ncbi:cryptochrome/photolyase family protein [Massilia pseudoviolaceinigra]|uniref:cryptochrome/photolyase family protein n=1 Tax=Massilia pseudoviolaceinigra TaxID=3057165 RepID=UPI002796C60F|nr:cryptochrome/photolyase family protein [Massilia sp. CCM 9206]MDQ1918832.1 cryptochrome/photolyase family protein [Massilia sp. CCM 9206]